MYHHFNIQQFYILPTQCIYVFVWIWEQTAIISLYSIDWLVFITETECFYCAVCSTFYILPTHCIYVFYVYLRTNSDYFTVQHWLVGFYNWDGVCLLRGTFYILHSAHTVYLCVLCGSQNKQRLFHCTALTGWLVFITETECVYCAVQTEFFHSPCTCCNHNNTLTRTRNMQSLGIFRTLFSFSIGQHWMWKYFKVIFISHTSKQ